jgi:beta-N-acetylhexosaminidase
LADFSGDRQSATGLYMVNYSKEVGAQSAPQTKAGRFFLLGWEGCQAAEPLELIERFKPAGLIFFSRNYPPGGGPELKEQLTELRRKAQSLSLSPFLLALDNEGGEVKRLPPPFVQLQAAADDLALEEIFLSARASGQQLADLGFNLNLAPVLDVDTSLGIMRSRAYGRKPPQVIVKAAAFARGFAASGVLTCGKHFPGLGAAHLDPHMVLPTVETPWEEINKIHLAPFRALLGQGLPMVMTTHCLYPALDDEKPATFSPKIVGLIRDDLGFDGLILSDDMEMGAVSAKTEPGAAAVASIAAGHDLILVCRRLSVIEASIQAVGEALETGVLPAKRLAATEGKLKNLKFSDYLSYDTGVCDG